jgi:hypothetical protein
VTAPAVTLFCVSGIDNALPAVAGIERSAYEADASNDLVLVARRGLN